MAHFIRVTRAAKRIVLTTIIAAMLTLNGIGCSHQAAEATQDKGSDPVEKADTQLNLIPTVHSSAGQDKKPAEKYMVVELGGGIKLKLVRIASGRFMMGSPKSEQDYVRKHFGDGEGQWAAQ